MFMFERLYTSPLKTPGMKAEVVAGRKHYKEQDKMISPTKKQRDGILLDKWCVIEIIAPKAVHRWLLDKGFKTLTSSKESLRKKTALKKLKAKGLDTDFIRRFK